MPSGTVDVSLQMYHLQVFLLLLVLPNTCFSLPFDVNYTTNWYASWSSSSGSNGETTGLSPTEVGINHLPESFTAQVVLAEPISGCSPLGSASTRGGIDIEGKILLILHTGDCSWEYPPIHAQSTVNPGATLYVPSPEVFGEINADKFHQVRGLHWNNVQAPHLATTWYFGNRLIQALLRNETVTMTIPGSGPLTDTGDRDALLQIYDNMVESSTREEGDGSQLLNWDTLRSSPGLDPCVTRVAGVTCLNGRVAFITVASASFMLNYLPSDALAQLSELRVLDLGELHSVYRLPLPCMFGHPSLLTLIIANSGERNSRIHQMDVCQGVDVAQSTLQRLVLRNVELAYINLDIPRLRHLRTLVVAEQMFSGTLPDLSALTALEEFDFHQSSINRQVASMLPNPASLRYIDLSGNSISGNLPASYWDNCPRLQYVDLSGNDFDAGALPNFQQATDMLYLDLSLTGFTGRLPSAWSGLSSLQTLAVRSLRDSSLTGPLMPALSNKRALRHLDLAHNTLAPADLHEFDSLGEWMQQFHLDALQVLDLAGNQLSHNNISGVTSALPSLRFLNVSHNDLTGFLNLREFVSDPSSRVLSADFSYNDLVALGVLDPGALASSSSSFITGGNEQGALQFLDLYGNRNLRPEVAITELLPEGFQFQPVLTKIEHPPGSGLHPFSCPEVTGVRGLRGEQRYPVRVDPALYSYTGETVHWSFRPEVFGHLCRCEPGYFEDADIEWPDACKKVPASIPVGFGDEFGDGFSGMAYERKATSGSDTKFLLRSSAPSASVTLSYWRSSSEDESTLAFYLDLQDPTTPLTPPLTPVLVIGPGSTVQTPAKYHFPSARVLVHFTSRAEHGEHFKMSAKEELTCPTTTLAGEEAQYELQGGRCVLKEESGGGSGIPLYILVIAMVVALVVLGVGGYYATRLLRWYSVKWDIAYKDLVFSHQPVVLGTGQSSQVIQAEYRGKVVAVKRIPMERLNPLSHTPSLKRASSNVPNISHHTLDPTNSNGRHQPPPRQPDLFAEDRTSRTFGTSFKRHSSTAPLGPTISHDTFNVRPTSMEEARMEERMLEEYDRTSRMVTSEEQHALASQSGGGSADQHSFWNIMGQMTGGGGGDGSGRAAKEETRISPLQLFKKEVRQMAALRHPNVVRTIGATLGNTTSPALLVMECHKDSVASLVHDPMITLDPAMQLSLMLHVASGMHYLHSKGIVHSNLKATNVLIDSEFHAKIGSVMGKSWKNPWQNMMGVPYWMAPEVLNGYKRTKESDVYAYAFFLYELFARRTPYQDYHPESVVGRVKDLNAVDEFRPEITGAVPPRVCDLIKECWAKNPERRPTFEEIVKRIGKFTIQSLWPREVVQAQSMRKPSAGPEVPLVCANTGILLTQNGKMDRSRERSVTIVYIKLLEFKETTQALEPEQVITLLEMLQTAWETLAVKLKVTMLESRVGDPILGVTNLQDLQSDHCVRASRFAVRLVNDTKLMHVHPNRPELGRVGIQVGMHCGKVVSPVGVRNPACCVFGPTLRTAANMLELSQRNAILVSYEVERRIREQDPEMILRQHDVKVNSNGHEIPTFWLSTNFDVDPDADIPMNNDRTSMMMGISADTPSRITANAPTIGASGTT